VKSGPTACSNKTRKRRGATRGGRVVDQDRYQATVLGLGLGMGGQVRRRAPVYGWRVQRLETRRPGFVLLHNMCLQTCQGPNLLCCILQ
jgi:hypothetical protein